MFFLVLLMLYAAILIATAWVLIRKYRQSHDPGFLILGAALLVWPLLSGFLDYGERMMFERLTAGESVSLFPFSLVSAGRLSFGSLAAVLGYSHKIVQAGLILMGLMYTGRKPDSPSALINE